MHVKEKHQKQCKCEMADRQLINLNEHNKRYGIAMDQSIVERSQIEQHRKIIKYLCFGCQQIEIHSFLLAPKT